MSWLITLLPLATSVCKRFFKGRSRPEPAGNATNSDFPTRMIAFGQATGLGVPTFRNRSAAFTVFVRGVPYLVVLTAGHSIVIASASSQVEFPRGLPRELLPVIDRLNAGITTGSHYEVMEDESGASLCVMTKCGLHELTQPFFEGIVTELTFRISALDKVLVQNGYGQ